MFDKSVLELYCERIQKLEAEGATLLILRCPYPECSKEIKIPAASPGEFKTPLATCPHCTGFYWQIVQPVRAFALIAIPRAPQVGAVAPPTGPLTIPLPKICSDHYAAGWAYVDSYLQKGGDIAADVTAEWPEDKINGFWDRLAVEPSTHAAITTPRFGE